MRYCLNWLQLSNNQQMVDLADPAENLKFAGTLKNPISPPHDRRIPREMLLTNVQICTVLIALGVVSAIGLVDALLADGSGLRLPYQW